MGQRSWKKIELKNDLWNNYKSYNQLCSLAYTIEMANVEKITLDLQDVKFIASNLFSVLGCILDSFYQEHTEDSEALMLSGISPRIKTIVQKNGFCHHLGLEKIADVHNTVIPYKIFDVDEIDEYERYLTLSLFGRKDLPAMSLAMSDKFRDALLEIFNNVRDHTSSRSVFTCGQYFPQGQMLYFTIVDAGETIPYNVREYHIRQGLSVPSKSLEWATEPGNTTLVERTPRGIGLSIIMDFISLNEGEFFMVSGEEMLEITKKGKKYSKLDNPFKGTIVTIGFNMNDKSVYFIKEEHETIQF